MPEKNNISINDPLAVKIWSKKLYAEISKATPIWSLVGTGTESVIQLKDEMSKSSGDRVTFGLRKQLKGAGISEGDALVGSEEHLITHMDYVQINELAHAVRVKNIGTIDAQRVPYNLREEANTGLIDWYADRLSLMLHLHWGGYTAPIYELEGEEIQLKPVHYGFNMPTRPTASRWIIAGQKKVEEELSDKDKFDLSLIDLAVEKAKLANPKIRPIRMGSERGYILYLHPKQVRSLRCNTNPGQWLDIQKAANSGIKEKNPIFDGSLGMYNGVILKEAEHVVPGVAENNSQLGKVRRAVLLGAQSAILAFGKNQGVERYKLVEELFDYQRELGIACKTIIGVKKPVFNNEDFSVIAISTYVDS